MFSPFKVYHDNQIFGYGSKWLLHRNQKLFRSFFHVHLKKTNKDTYPQISYEESNYDIIYQDIMHIRGHWDMTWSSFTDSHVNRKIALSQNYCNI